MSKVPIETLRINVSDENGQEADLAKIKIYYMDKENPDSDVFVWTVQEDVASYVSCFLNVKNHYKDNTYSG